MNIKRSLLQSSLVLLVLGAVSTARAVEPASAKANAAAATRTDIAKTLGFVPQLFLKLPEEMLPGTWEEMKTLQMNPTTALGGRMKELIGLAVAAQVPCRYCIIGHTEFARLNGATDAEIGEAVGMAAITRHWSTMLNGMQVDEAQYRKDVERLVRNATSKKEHASR